MKKTPGLFSLLLLILCAGCSQKADRQAEVAKLMDVSREWSKTAATGDIEKIMGYWSDDAVMFSSGEPKRVGKEAIRKMVVESMQNPDFKISWEPYQGDVSVSGDMGYLLETTTFSLKDSVGNPFTLQYNGVTIWKKQSDGAWKNVVDVISPEK